MRKIYPQSLRCACSKRGRLLSALAVATLDMLGIGIEAARNDIGSNPELAAWCRRRIAAPGEEMHAEVWRSACSVVVGHRRAGVALGVGLESACVSVGFHALS